MVTQSSWGLLSSHSHPGIIFLQNSREVYVDIHHPHELQLGSLGGMFLPGPSRLFQCQSLQPGPLCTPPAPHFAHGLTLYSVRQQLQDASIQVLRCAAAPWTLSRSPHNSSH